MGEKDKPAYWEEMVLSLRRAYIATFSEWRRESERGGRPLEIIVRASVFATASWAAEQAVMTGAFVRRRFRDYMADVWDLEQLAARNASKEEFEKLAGHKIDLPPPLKKDEPS